MIDRVNRLWQKQFRQPFVPKAQADYSKIIQLRHVAAGRAKKHCEAKNPSWTEVYKIIEDIDSLLPLAGDQAK